MNRSLTITAIAIAVLGYGAVIDLASAQTFEERWAPIPKAHAEPSTPPGSASPSDTNQRETNEPKVSQPPVAETPRAEAGKTGSRSSSLRRAGPRKAFTGRASYYAYHGGKTASGQLFSRSELTAAHRTLPFGTRVRVTDIKTNKSVVVVITDRGPASRQRVLDLSLAAARALSIGSRGVIQVRAEIIS